MTPRCLRHRVPILLVLAILCVLLGSGPMTWAQPAGGIIAVDVPGASATFVSGINNAGQIVGAYTVANGPSVSTHGFVRTSEGVFSSFTAEGAFVGAVLIYPDGINDAGQIVGHFTESGKQHGFLRAAGGAVTVIDAPGATETTAAGINNAGQIVGFFTDTAGKVHGFFRAVDGTFAVGAPGSDARGINNAGQIVGTGVDAGGRVHGYLRAAGGTYTAIDAPGATATEASAINDAGQIVGFFTDAGGRRHGYVRAAAGTFTTIDAPGAAVTFARGINNAGQIVGTFSRTGSGDYHGYIAGPGVPAAGGPPPPPAPAAPAGRGPGPGVCLTVVNERDQTVYFTVDGWNGYWEAEPGEGLFGSGPVTSGGAPIKSATGQFTIRGVRGTIVNSSNISWRFDPTDTSDGCDKGTWELTFL